MAQLRKTAGIRALPPSGKHKSFRFQKQEEANSKWTTIKTDEIDAFNRLYREGTLSDSDTKSRVAAILASLYLKRDAGKPRRLALPGNVKILNKFTEETYTPSKLLRMADGSHAAAINYLNAALKAVGDVPVDGPADPIQATLDQQFRSRPNIHSKHVMAVNRLRKYLALPYIHHLRSEDIIIVYLSEAEIVELIGKLDDPYRTIVAVAFYTGLRKGEIFGLEPHDIKAENTLNIVRQITVKGETKKPKNRKARKAFVLPGGMEWVRRWLEMKTGVGRSNRVNGKIRDAGVPIRFHDLRHSYAVHLIGKGATLEWVARSMGHSTDVCERYYAGFVLTDDAITLMQKLVSGN